jgi:hypothetical protein
MDKPSRRSDFGLNLEDHKMTIYALAALDNAAECQAEVRILRSKFSSWVVQGLFLNRISETLPTTLAIGNEDLKIAVSLFKDEASQNTYHLASRFFPDLAEKAYQATVSKLADEDRAQLNKREALAEMARLSQENEASDRYAYFRNSF